MLPLRLAGLLVVLALGAWPLAQAPTPPTQAAPDSVEGAPPQGAPSQSSRPPAAAPVPGPLPGDTLRADTLAADSAATVRPVTPAEQAMARLRAAAADSAGLAPQGPLPPLAAALAGMVWAPPAETAAALDALLALRRAGVRQVRTGLVEDTLLLAAGDVLGVAFYQDLPVANLPAARLLDTLAYAERALAAALARSAPYASARHFGLAQYADTSDPRARPYFERLRARLAADGPEGAQVYYVSRFVEADRCARTVDFVLLDARGADPVRALARWRARHETPAGLGAVGAAVQEGRDGGWRVPGTPAAQARALERALTGLLALPEPPVASFVYRWRDHDDPAAALAQSSQVAGRSFGLHDEAGDPRPAFHVVRGLFTGTQRVFAFDAGRAEPEAQAVSVLVLLGWLLLLAVGLLYALTPRFGTLLPRYFARHDLYRESIQRGYDLDFAPNALLAGALSLAAGVIGGAVLRGLARTDALAAATSSLPDALQAGLTRLVSAPILLVLVVAAVYALYLLLNLVWLFALAGRRYRLRPPQGLTLIVWSRWAVFALLLVAMLLTTLPADAGARLVPALVVAWLVVEAVAAARVLYDFALVARVPTARALGGGYLVPSVVIAGGVVALAALAWPELSFLWHLATRS